jgi:hypothetical protein
LKDHRGGSKKKMAEAVLRTAQKRPAANPLINVVIMTAGENVTKGTPTTYGSMIIPIAEAMAAHRKAKAYAPTVPGRSAGISM